MGLRICFSIYSCVPQSWSELRKCISIFPFVHPSAYPISVGVYLIITELCNSGYSFPFSVASSRSWGNSGNAIPFVHLSILLHTRSLWGYILTLLLMGYLTINYSRGGSPGPRQFYVSFANLLGLKWGWTLYPIRIKSNCEQIKKELGQKNLLLRNDKQKKTMFISRKIAQNCR